MLLQPCYWILFNSAISRNNKIFLFDSKQKRNVFLEDLHTINYGFVENVYSFLAKTCKEDGEEYTQEIMQFEEAVNEYYGCEDADEDPTSHHPDRRSLVALRKSVISRRSPYRGLNFGNSRHCRNSSRQFIDLSERLMAFAGVCWRFSSSQ